MSISGKLAIEESRAEIKPESDIFVVGRANGRDGGFNSLIDLMGNEGLLFYRSKKKARNIGPKGLIPRDAVVIVKVNCQWDERGGTNTDLTRSIIEAILDHPNGFDGEIVVADNGQDQFGAHGYGGDLDWDLNNAEDKAQSVQKVVDSFKGRRVSAFLWDRIATNKVEEYSDGNMEDGFVVDDDHKPSTMIRISYPKFRTEFGTNISFKHGVWNSKARNYDKARIKILNVPILKAHRTYGVTSCIKNYMGVTSDKLTKRTAHKSVGKGGMGTQMAHTRIPVLNILDAIWVNANPGTGPRTTYEEATRLNMIMASVDPVALDYWAAKTMLIQTAILKGYKDLSSIDPDNTTAGSFGDWLRLSMEELRKTGLTVTTNQRRMNVYVHNIKH